MATNYPGSLDNFTNPSSGNTLDSPSHSLQHSDINDAVEAIETKLGAGSATPGTATAFFPLVAGTAGATSWTQLTAAGITSGTATSGQVLAANGSGAVSFTTPTVPGLVQIVPSSISVGSGSGSANANGFITFSGASSLSINDLFNTTYDNYRIIGQFTAVTGGANIFGRLRVSGVDTSTNYQTTAIYLPFTGTPTITGINTALGTTGMFFTNEAGAFSVDLYSPFLVQGTRMNGNYQGPNDGQVLACKQTGSTSFTGLTFYPSTGTMTGTIAVYGYRD
jgi:hypothetical protein